MRAVIVWKRKEQGGRRKPPLGVGEPPYSPVIRFIDEPWPAKVSWSVCVRKERERGDPLRWAADVRFRFEDAPHHSLREGRQFELYEGPHCVASGHIIGDAVLVNDADSGISGGNSG